MDLDGSVLGAIFGFLGLVVSTIGGVFIATRTNKTEKETAAIAAIEQTKVDAYEQRIKLRDEQIADLKSDIVVLKLEIEERESENDKLSLEVQKLKGGSNA